MPLGCGHGGGFSGRSAFFRSVVENEKILCKVLFVIGAVPLEEEFNTMFRNQFVGSCIMAI